MDIINSLASSFRGALVYSMGKLTLAVDMPDELPTMLFNETNIETGSLHVSGIKESDIVTGVDVSYIEPTNHYKRETVRIDTADANDGVDRNAIPNITSLDLQGATRRSQALRYAQYHIAASRYQRRSVTFTTSTEALSLAPGDVISVAQQQSGIAYGYSGKITANTNKSTNTNVFAEHFTAPSLSSSIFTANTGPLALRIIKTDSDRMDLYLISNTSFALTKTDNVSTGFDLATFDIISKFSPITRTFVGQSQFQANNAPVKGDLWSLGEIVDPNDVYTNKAGKLFKVTSIERDADEASVALSAIEYISNVYVDSDTFIDYKPTAYTDILSPFTTPPAPNFEFRAVPKRRSDGSVTVDGIIEERTEKLGYAQDYRTDFLISRPDSVTLVANSTPGSPLTVEVSNSSVLSDGTTPAELVGKNGFNTTIGEIKLLCNGITTVDTAGGTLDGNVQLTLEGLNVAFDENFFKHVLEVNDPGVFQSLKGTDFITVPIKEKSGINSALNFVAFAPQVTDFSANIAGFDKSTNTVKFNNTLSNGIKLIDVIPEAPFFVTINQLLDSRHYHNNSFYISEANLPMSKKATLTQVQLPLSI